MKLQQEITDKNSISMNHQSNAEASSEKRININNLISRYKKEKAREHLNKVLEIWKDADADYIFSNMAKATAQEWKIEILN